MIISLFLAFSSQFFVHCKDIEYPIFYAIEPAKGGGIDVFARVFEECGLWRSTADEYFLYRGDANGYWFIEDIQNPETNKQTCSVYPQKQGNFRIKLPESPPLPKEKGWVNANADLPTTVIFFQLEINENDSSYGGYPGYSLTGDYEKIEKVDSHENCKKKAKEIISIEEDDEYLFVSSTIITSKTYMCRYVKFSFSRLDSVTLEKKDDSVLNVFHKINEDEDNKCNEVTDPEVRRINIFQDLKKETLPPFYLIEPVKNEGINVYTRASMDCGIYKSTINNNYLYKEEDTGFWYIEDFEKANLTDKCCSIDSKMTVSHQRLEFHYDYTLPGEDGWKIGDQDAKFTFFKFEPCDKREGFIVSSGQSWPKDNISDCFEFAKRFSGLDYIFVSVENKTEVNKVECKSIGISPFGNIRKISVEPNSASVLYLLDRKCKFEDMIELTLTIDEDVEEEDSSSEINIIIGAVVGGLVLIIIIIALSVIIVFQRKTETVKVHRNDLYGNISNQEEHKERYDTNIVDSNQFYEDYDNDEL